MFDLDKMITEAYGPDLDKIISETYDSKAPMSIEKLSEMVENMLVLQESLDNLSEQDISISNNAPQNLPTTGDIPKPQKINPMVARFVPLPPVSELKWGQASTKQSDISNSAREQLRIYLDQISGSDIKEKLENINAFISQAKSGGQQLQAVDTSSIISFLVFYKTLSTIITNFNAAGAGFIFESFLAVLLDSKRGKQIPASDGATIADIIVYPSGNSRLPISIKLYGEDTIKVGGSYKQLISDLTTQYPKMQYLVVGKESTGRGDEREITKLNFYSFDFTLRNVIKVLNYLSPSHAGDILQLPLQIVEAWNNSDKNKRKFSRSIMPTRISGLERAIAGSSFEQADDIENIDPEAGFEDDLVRYKSIDFQIPRGDKISPIFGFLATINKIVHDIKNIKLGGGDSGDTRDLGEILQDEDILPKIVESFVNQVNKHFIVDGPDALEKSNLTTIEDKFNPENVTLDFGYYRNSDDGKPKYLWMSSGVTPYNSGKPNNVERDALTAPILKIISDKLKETDISFDEEKLTAGLKAIITGAFKTGKEVNKSKGAETGGVSPRTMRINQIWGDSDKKQSIELLEAFANSTGYEETYKRLLRMTKGFSLNRQFEISRAQFGKLMESLDADYLPYGNDKDKGSFSSLDIGEEVVLTVINNAINKINVNMKVIFENLASLSDNINKFVAGGLEDIDEGGTASIAQNNADTISKKTSDVRAIGDSQAEYINPRSVSGGRFKLRENT